MTESHEEAVDRIFTELAAEQLPEQRAASLERAERLRWVQARGHREMGGPKSPEGTEKIVRRTKGKHSRRAHSSPSHEHLLDESRNPVSWDASQAEGS